MSFYNPMDFRRGGLKGNDQKKYTMEVKTVKARKSDGLVYKRSKKCPDLSPSFDRP